MFNVMLVDDEAWIRRGMANLIDWEELEMVITKECEDGEEALMEIEQAPPDLVLMDMRMPGLDGKELIRELNKDFPELLVIVISGYDDFEYTYEAIKHQAFDYLLKPVRKEELTKVLENAKQKLVTMREEADTLKEHETLDFQNAVKQFLFQKDYHARKTLLNEYESIGPIFHQDTEKTVCVGQLDSFQRIASEKAAEEKIKLVKDIAVSILNSAQYDYLLLEKESHDNFIVLVFYSPSIEKETIEKMIKSISKETELQTASTISFGLSSPVKDPLQLRDAYSSAYQALKRKGIHDISKICSERTPSPEEVFIFPQEKEHAFLLSLKSGETDKSLYQFDQFCESLSKGNLSVESMQKGFIILLHSMEKLLNSYNKNLEVFASREIFQLDHVIKSSNSMEEITQLYRQLILNIAEWFQSSSYGQGREITKQIIQEIEHSFFKPLSLSEIADDYYVNADYLSRLFKKETGKNFVDYLTDYRIEKAKELLRYENYKNYEIAAMVGYENYRYFSQIFKKRVGMTIGEYRRTLKKTKLEKQKI